MLSSPTDTYPVFKKILRPLKLLGLTKGFKRISQSLRIPYYWTQTDHNPPGIPPTHDKPEILELPESHFSKDSLCTQTTYG